MDKKFNPLFILSGIVIFMLTVGFYNNFLPSIVLLFLLITSPILISFGIINYTKFRLWIKILLGIICTIVLTYLFIGIILCIYNNCGLF